MIFDRDGTLIDFHRDPELGVVTPAFHPAQLRPLPGAFEAVRRLRARGVRVAVATNQPGAAKGEIPRAAIERTNAGLCALFAEAGAPLDALRACLHHPTGGPGGDAALVATCDCRKPAPGLLLALARELGVAPEACWMVGDTRVDIAAGRAAGMRVCLVSPTDRCELCPHRTAEGRTAGADAPAVAPDAWAARLDEAVDRLLAAPC